ncbi:SGNH/GDSL hydrolase family protein [Leptospira idonii]|uniref:SGNH/GDSL hydrolase family protein n=1 Tax=Leptospira idonii TaxID=1193500 RepID=A0A4R9LZU2_9LEPT|nr:SGNH/GDSL hydrolase family protein [Leptospira idonii]TGN19964.1 SGNH/GDSL hydrolase family protein [Leptospira idonii]
MKFLNKGLFSLIFFLFCGCAFFQATKIPENNIENSLQKGKPARPVVLFLGDSITHGTVSFNYVNDVKQNHDHDRFNFINEGINSRLTDQIIEQFENIEKLSPDIIFLLIGTNDLKASLNEGEFLSYQKKWGLKENPTESRFQENYKTIVRFLKKNRNSQLVLISIPPLGEALDSIPLQRSMDYSKIIKKIASEEKTGYIPLNETLVNKLKESPEKELKEYKRNPWGMYVSILKYYSTTKSWNDISEDNGYLLLTDGIHLNDVSGKILSSLVTEELIRLSSKK